MSRQHTTTPPLITGKPEASATPRQRSISRTSRTGRALQLAAAHGSVWLQQIREHLRSQQYGDIALTHLRREVTLMLLAHKLVAETRRDLFEITDAGRALVALWRSEPPPPVRPRPAPAAAPSAARGGVLGQPAKAVSKASKAVLSPSMHQAQHVRGPHLGAVAGGAAGEDCSYRFVRRDGLQHQHLPSRRGNKLYYRDGRVEDISHAAQTPRRPQLGMPDAPVPRTDAPANDTPATPAATPRRRRAGAFREAA